MDLIELIHVQQLLHFLQEQHNLKYFDDHHQYKIIKNQ